MNKRFQFKFPTGTGTSKRVTGKAADAGYTVAKAAQQQAANRQTVQDWWNTGQAKAAQDNSTNKAYTAKLTGGANIDNSKALVGNLQNTFSGYKDSTKTQTERALQSKLGQGRNWSSPKSAAGNVLMSAAADTTASWLNAAGTALKSNRKSGLAVDSGAVPAKTTGNEWYNRAGNYLQREADKVQQIGKIAYHRGSYGLNNAQKLLYDTGIAATQMAGDLALGMGGSATIPMAIRSFGSGAMEARQAGASENDQIFYGVANAAVEAATEKMFDGVARIYGKGMADDMVDEFAKRWAKSEGGQALIRGAAGIGGEGLEEVVSSLANPALKTIYNGKSLRENYSDLNLNDVVYEGMIGALLGNIGGAVNIAQAGRSNTQNYQQGNSRAFGGQMRKTNPADVSRNADLNTLYTAAGSNAQRSIPYAAAHATSVQQQRSTPYTNAPNSIGTAGRSQTLSYADVFRKMQAEQNMSADSEYARYKELDRKFLDGSISAEEFEELRKLDNVWREVDVPGKHTGTDSDPEYARYKELEHKFLDGSIDEQEWNELLKLENDLGQFGGLNVVSEVAAEWEDSLRRKPHNDTMNKMMDFWEEIKRNGQVERGKQAFEGDGTLHWEKTSRSHRVAAERRNAFLDRMERSDARTYWVEGISYGYRPVFLRNASSYAKEVVSELQKFGITKYFVFDGEVQANYAGRTTADNADALTLRDGTVGVNNIAAEDLDALPAKEVAAHEAIHSKLDANDSHTLDYQKVIVENLKTDSELFQLYYFAINEAYFDGNFDYWNKEHQKKFFSEFCAYVSGHIYSGSRDTATMFEDYDEVCKALGKALGVF